MPPTAWQVDLPLLAAYAWFAWVGSVTPGPNCTLALSASANFGPRSVLPHMAGVAIGLSTLLTAVLAGAHGLILGVPALALSMKWIGIAWLGWMGLQLMRSSAIAERASARPPRIYESALLQYANPKAWMLATATAGAYQDLARPIWLNGALIVSIFVSCSLLALVVWAGLGSTLRDWLRVGSRLLWFNRVLGLSLIATAAWLGLA